MREALEFPPREILDTARSKAAILLSCSSAGSLRSACSAISANSRANCRVEIFLVRGIRFSSQRRTNTPLAYLQNYTHSSLHFQPLLTTSFHNLLQLATRQERSFGRLPPRCIGAALWAFDHVGGMAQSVRSALWRGISPACPSSRQTNR